LKPDNVLLQQGKWKIADFGIARFVDEATSTNTLREHLTDAYAAPEQWRSERATHATDVYALGCIAFCLLTGNPPFTKDPQAEHQRAPVPPFTCAEPRLANLINWCLRKLAAVRPSLSRVHDLLDQIVANPQKANASNALNDLAQAAAYVSAREQEAEAKKEAEIADRNARLTLAESAFQALAANAERLCGKIQSQAANANRSPKGARNELNCQIGNNFLGISLNPDKYVESGAFSRSGWDVVAWSKILVRQYEPGYDWSASLWFAKIARTTDYRWYEVAYCRLSFDRGRTFGRSVEGVWPFAADRTDADLAAAPHSNHLIQIAFGPVAIDDELEQEFHERWISLLAKAAKGELRTPTQIPFQWPPPLS
jgi:eukaryotic-like serine/threonine-protein kinase